MATTAPVVLACPGQTILATLPGPAPFRWRIVMGEISWSTSSTQNLLDFVQGWWQSSPDSATNRWLVDGKAICTKEQLDRALHEMIEAS